MKVVRTITNGSTVKKDFIIYEREEEIEENNIVVKELEEANPGEYVRTDNGFYIPLLYTTTRRNPKNKYETFYAYHFPRYTYRILKNHKENFTYHKVFSYPTEPQQYLTQNLSSQSRLVATLVGQGIPLYKALLVAYPNKHSYERESIGRRLMENKRFIKFLIGKTDMKKLQEALEEEGLSYNFLAESLKKEIEKGKSGLEAIKFGFNVVKTAEEAIEQENNKELSKNNDITAISNSLLEKKKKELSE